MSETVRERRRRKFSAGVLDQFASALGAYSAGIVVAAVIAPLAATILGATELPLSHVTPLVAGGALTGLLFLLVSVLLKGWSKMRDDDGAKLDANPPLSSYTSPREVGHD